MAQGKAANFFLNLAYRLVKWTIAWTPAFLYRVYEAVFLFFFFRITTRQRDFRRIATKNLAIAFPEKSLAERRRLIKNSARNVARLVWELDRFFVHGDELDRLVTEENLDSMRQALGENKGVIIVSGHLFHWDLGLAWFCQHVRPIWVVAMKMVLSSFENDLQRFRARAHSHIIYNDDRAMLKMKKILEEREVVTIMMDINQPAREGIFVDFFGLPASTTPAAAYLHFKTGAPIVPISMRRNGRGYSICSLPLLTGASTGDIKADVYHLTARINAVLEEEIRRAPENYFWFLRRWFTRPEGEEKVY
jgi:KDO2-lipid IV(A) lauroyltransferase